MSLLCGGTNLAPGPTATVCMQVARPEKNVPNCWGDPGPINLASSTSRSIRHDRVQASPSIVSFTRNVENIYLEHSSPGAVGMHESMN